MYVWIVRCTRASVDPAGPELRLAPRLDGLQKGHKLLRPDRVTSGKTRDVSRVRNHVQPWRPSHVWACGKSIFFSVNPSPFVPAWQLDKSPERSAVQESSARCVLSEGWCGKFWQGHTVHKGLDSNGVESHRETNFFEARAVHKGEFLYFFHLCG